MRGGEERGERVQAVRAPVREAELLSDRHEPSWPFGGPWCHCQQERAGGLVTVATDSWDPGPSRSSYLNPLTSAQHSHFIINSLHPARAGRFLRFVLLVLVVFWNVPVVCRIQLHFIFTTSVLHLTKLANK